MAVVTGAGGLVLGLLAAVLIGVILTLLLVIVELDRVGVTELQPTSGDRDLEAAGDHTESVTGLLILRFDGPLYTANIRSVNRKILAEIDRHPGTGVLVLDATSVARFTLTVAEEFNDLERELRERGVELWVAALTPMALEMARKLPRWPELDEAKRLYPTSLAALNAYRASS